MECEICGSASTLVKISINGTILRACNSCSSAGKIIGEPIADHLPLPTIRESNFAAIAPQGEELLVADFSKKISQARQQLGLKQEEFAQKINEKLSIIQAAESGKRCDLSLAKKLEKTLNIDLIEFV